MSEPSPNDLKPIISWHLEHGRHDLPWQQNPNPYRVWVSEIMLQQTQVTTVIPYYNRFMDAFPTVERLANASQDDVLSHWSGLGYYARARNLHKAANIILAQFEGHFPKDIDALTTLPGIGRSTAGAIASFSMGVHAAILDGNVKRVLTRFYAVEGWPGKSDIHKQLWQLAEKNTPTGQANIYNQAIMDLGATVCTRTKPSCTLCPIMSNCKAHQTNTTDQYPTRKPKITKPIKETIALLVCSDEGEVLLQKRPDKGIWGGLWSFPECEMDTNIPQYCQEHFLTKCQEVERLPTLTHQFSHYQLNIHPIKLKANKPPYQVMDVDTYFWYKLNTNALPGGIPTPLRKLINQLET